MNWSEILDYDPATGFLFWKERPGNAMFNSKYAGRRAGCRHHLGYINVRMGTKDVPAHRIVWYLVKGVVEPELDHANGDRADNRIENLRPATRSQNCANRRIFKRQQVGVKGVSYDARKKLYRARIQINKKRITLGRFKSAAAAQAAYIQAAKIYFGEFANAG